MWPLPCIGAPSSFPPPSSQLTPWSAPAPPLLSLPPRYFPVLCHHHTLTLWLPELPGGSWGWMELRDEKCTLANVQILRARGISWPAVVSRTASVTNRSRRLCRYVDGRLFAPPPVVSSSTHPGLSSGDAALELLFPQQWAAHGQRMRKAVVPAAPPVRGSFRPPWAASTVRPIGRSVLLPSPPSVPLRHLPPPHWKQDR